MTNVLIVESDPKEIADLARTRGSAAQSEIYRDVLLELQPDLEIEIVCPYDDECLLDFAKFDGVVFTGSSVEWNTDDARAEPLAKVMRAVFGNGVPAYGSCNGMQLAATVLGGSSQASPNGREDGLAKDIRLSEAGRDHPMLAGRKDGYAVPCIHRDEVVRLPNQAVLLAGNAHSAVQAFAYEQNGIRFWGSQYHPEYDPAHVGRYAERTGSLPKNVATDLIAATHDPAAAYRLGTSVEEQKTSTRTLELQNWLRSLASDG